MRLRQRSFKFQEPGLKYKPRTYNKSRVLSMEGTLHHEVKKPAVQVDTGVSGILAWPLTVCVNWDVCKSCLSVISYLKLEKIMVTIS